MAQSSCSSMAPDARTLPKLSESRNQSSFFTSLSTVDSPIQTLSQPAQSFFTHPHTARHRCNFTDSSVHRTIAQLGRANHVVQLPSQEGGLQQGRRRAGALSTQSVPSMQQQPPERGVSGSAPVGSVSDRRSDVSFPHPPPRIHPALWPTASSVCSRIG